MALHYSAHQFDQAYKPRVLGNWEVPKQFHDKPHTRKGRTEIISNDRGHLLPGVPKSGANPWGNYVGTWHLPKQIDRKLANQMNGTDPKQIIRCKCKLKPTKIAVKAEKQSPKVAEKEGDEQQPEETDEGLMKNEIATDKDKDKENIENYKTVPYVPGDLTEPRHRPPEYESLAANRFNQDEVKEITDSSKGYPKYREDFSACPDIEKNKPITRDEVEEMYQKTQEMKQSEFINPDNRSHGKKKSTLSPFISALKNFQLAKKLHRENLEHDPLPDTLSNSKYKKWQMENLKEPGLVLDQDNYATAVGWKGHPGYGPTRCTKLKVFRPKTTGGGDCNKNNNNINGRPSSVNSFDLKWRFIRQRKVSPIELAICWDLTPENSKDEPKRPTHIDGSNGSQAPAVFSLVQTPKDDEESRKNSIVPLFERAPAKTEHETDFVLDRPKTSDVKRRTSNASSESQSIKKRAKSAYNLNLNNADDEERCSRCSREAIANKYIRQSTPNLSVDDNKRMCMACEMKRVSLNKNNNRDRKRSEFKMAFKAGVPQNQCRKDKRQDYPEHWRLATVYQHSYKPIHARKRPMLDTVFK